METNRLRLKMVQAPYPALLLATFLLAPFTSLCKTPVEAKVTTAFRSRCETLLLQHIEQARKKILVAAFSFTNRRIANALVNARKRGVEVCIKMDRRQAEKNYSKRIVKLLRRGKTSFSTILMPPPYSMHNKFMVIDGNTVLTGSYNFTVAATKTNWENLICIESKTVAQAFAREWTNIENH